MAERCNLAGLRGAMQTPSQGLSRITRRRPFFGGTVTIGLRTRNLFEHCGRSRSIGWRERTTCPFTL